MKRLRVLNIVGGLAALLLIGSTLWLGGGWGRLLAAPNAGVPAHYLQSWSGLHGRHAAPNRAHG